MDADHCRGVDFCLFFKQGNEWGEEKRKSGDGQNGKKKDY